MAGRSNVSAPGAHLSRQAGVYGLEAGRDLARRGQRSRRRRNRVVRSLLTVVVIGFVGGAGWFGYTAYVEHDTNEQVENDRRVAEIEQQRIGRTTDDLIEQLEQTPAWNGPGNPTFGVGDDIEPDTDP